MEQLKGLLSNIQVWFSSLTSRERTLVLLASGATAAFLVFLILFSFSASAGATRRRTEQKLSKLQEAQSLAESYREADRARQDMERQLGGGAIHLISYIEEKGEAAGLEVTTMNPKGDVGLGDGKIVESAVELTFTDIPLTKLHAFLSSVEHGPGVVKVKFLRLEPRIASETVTAWITIATYRLKQ